MDASTETRDRLLSRRNAKPKSAAPHEYAELSLSRTHVILDWYYFAIVSLAHTKDFQESPKWIAQRLGISQAIVVSALSRLEEVGLLARDKKGNLQASHSNFATPSDIPNYALRKRHFQHLELASFSLESDDVLERDFSAMTIATTRSKMKEAKERIKQFRRSLCAFLESGEKEDVFLLNIQLFPLTTKEGERS